MNTHRAGRLQQFVRDMWPGSGMNMLLGKEGKEEEGGEKAEEGVMKKRERKAPLMGS